MPAWKPARSVLGYFLTFAAIQQAGATQPPPIVGPLPNLKPVHSTDHDPSAQALIGTWLAGSDWPAGKRFDQERYQILDYRLAWGDAGRAIVVFRLLPLQSDTQADAVALAAKRCPGRKTPIDIQIYYEWVADRKEWTALDQRGDPGFNACPGKATFWRADQLARLVNPPALPAPPKIEQKDVATPAPGTADRAALLDAVRPIYEKLFGKPIKFKVETMRMAAGFAFMSVHPQRADGSPIEQKVWDKVIHDCEHNPLSVTHEYWMQKIGKTWKIGLKNQFCADDSISSEGDIIGAPPQLAEKDHWEARTTYPVDQIDTGSF